MVDGESLNHISWFYTCKCRQALQQMVVGWSVVTTSEGLDQEQNNHSKRLWRQHQLKMANKTCMSDEFCWCKLLTVKSSEGMQKTS